ncbi:uncharacterized protein LOC144902977 isoform X4 [Branchiostoma floridae x Branchiostoma belcheri]
MSSRRDRVGEVAGMLAVLLAAACAPLPRGTAAAVPRSVDPVVNVAQGKPVRANVTCGSPLEDFYPHSDSVKSPPNRQLQICDASDPILAHNASLMLDGNSSTWWQSTSLQQLVLVGNGIGNRPEVYITLDLGETYHPENITIHMGDTKRPGRLALLRSADGLTFQPWLYLVSNGNRDCRRFGVAELSEPTSPESVVCREYTQLGVEPLYNERITVSLMEVPPSFSDEDLLSWQAVRHLQLRFYDMDLVLGIFEDQFHHYAVSEVCVMAACECNGFGNGCEINSDSGQYECICSGYTQGAHCEECQPLYNQFPYKPEQPCQACNCNNHSEVCVYNETVSVGNQSLAADGRFHGGGVCLSCHDNTTGINCERCDTLFYMNPKVSHQSSSACLPCGCDLTGASGLQCNMTTGQCPCKPGVGGRMCDICLPGYYNLTIGGCTPCPCHPLHHTPCHVDQWGQVKCNCTQGHEGEHCESCGEFYWGDPVSGSACTECDCSGNSDQCDNVTGDCTGCQHNTTGSKCDRCTDGFYGDAIFGNCSACACDEAGSVNLTCDHTTGQCPCKPGVDNSNRRCSSCMENHYGFDTPDGHGTDGRPGCSACNCNILGSDSSQCGEGANCSCRHGVEGNKCDRCMEGTYGLPDMPCQACDCDLVGTEFDPYSVTSTQNALGQTTMLGLTTAQDATEETTIQDALGGTTLIIDTTVQRETTDTVTTVATTTAATASLSPNPSGTTDVTTAQIESTEINTSVVTGTPEQMETTDFNTAVTAAATTNVTSSVSTPSDPGTTDETTAQMETTDTVLATRNSTTPATGSLGTTDAMPETTDVATVVASTNNMTAQTETTDINTSLLTTNATSTATPIGLGTTDVTVQTGTTDIATLVATTNHTTVQTETTDINVTTDGPQTTDVTTVQTETTNMDTFVATTNATLDEFVTTENTTNDTTVGDSVTTATTLGITNVTLVSTNAQETNTSSNESRRLVEEGFQARQRRQVSAPVTNSTQQSTTVNTSLHTTGINTTLFNTIGSAPTSVPSTSTISSVSTNGTTILTSIDPASTAPHPAPTSIDLTSTAPDPAPTSIDPTSTAPDPAPTSIDPTSTAPDPTSTSIDPTSTASDPTPTSIDPTSTAPDPAPTSIDPTSTSPDPAPTSIDPTSTAPGPTPTSIDPTSTAPDPAPTSIDPTSTSPDPAPTSIDPTSTAPGPTPTSIDPTSTAPDPAPTSIDPTSTAPDPTSTSIDLTSTAPDPAPTSIDPTSTAPDPAPTSIDPTSTSPDPAPTSIDPTSTAPGPTPTSIDPTSTAPDPAPTSIDPTSTAPDPTSTSIDLTSTAPDPAPTSIDPTSTAPDPTSTSIDLTSTAPDPAPTSIDPTSTAPDPAPTSIDPTSTSPDPAPTSIDPTSTAPGPTPTSIDPTSTAPDPAPTSIDPTSTAPDPTSTSIDLTSTAPDPAPTSIDPTSTAPDPTSTSIDLTSTAPDPAPTSIDPTSTAPGPTPTSIDPTSTAPDPTPTSIDPTSTAPDPAPTSIDPTSTAPDPTSTSIDLTSTAPDPAPTSIDPTSTAPDPTSTSIDLTSTAPDPAPTSIDPTSTAPDPAPTSIDPTSTSPDPAPTSIDPTSTAPGPTPTSIDPTSTAPDPAPTSIDPTSTAPDPTSTSIDLTSTAPDPAPTSIDPASTASDPTPTSIDPTSTTPDPTPTSIDPTSTAPDPAPTSINPTSSAPDPTPASNTTTSSPVLSIVPTSVVPTLSPPNATSVTPVFGNTTAAPPVGTNPAPGTTIFPGLVSSNHTCQRTTGQCRCKPGVGGRSCNVCLPMFHGFGPTGCSECSACEQTLDSFLVKTESDWEHHWGMAEEVSTLQMLDTPLQDINITIETVRQDLQESELDLGDVNGAVSNLTRELPGLNRTAQSLRSQVSALFPGGRQQLNSSSMEYMRLEQLKRIAHDVLTNATAANQTAFAVIHQLSENRASARTMLSQAVQLLDYLTAVSFDGLGQQSQAVQAMAGNELKAAQGLNTTVYTEVQEATTLRDSLTTAQTLLSNVNDTMDSTEMIADLVLTAAENIEQHLTIANRSRQQVATLVHETASLLPIAETALQAADLVLQNATQDFEQAKILLNGENGWTATAAKVNSSSSQVAGQLVALIAAVQKAEGYAANLTVQADAVDSVFQAARSQGQSAVSAIQGYQEVALLLNESVSIATEVNATVQNLTEYIQSVSIATLEGRANRSLAASLALQEEIDGKSTSTAGILQEVRLANASFSAVQTEWRNVTAQLQQLERDLQDTEAAAQEGDIATSLEEGTQLMERSANQSTAAEADIAGVSSGVEGVRGHLVVIQETSNNVTTIVTDLEQTGPRMAQ